MRGGERWRKRREEGQRIPDTRREEGGRRKGEERETGDGGKHHDSDQSQVSFKTTCLITEDYHHVFLTVEQSHCLPTRGQQRELTVTGSELVIISVSGVLLKMLDAVLCIEQTLDQL